MVKKAPGTLWAAIVAVLLGSAVAYAQTPLSNRDRSFLRGYFDHQGVAIGYDRLALKKASKEAVRRFARAELDMYRSLGTRLQALDRESGSAAIRMLDAPSVRGGGDSGPYAVVNDTAWLETLSGDRFDKEFLLRAILMHQRMIRHSLREMAAPGANPEVVAYARAALALLNEQTEAAGNLYNGLVFPAGPPPSP